MQSSPSGFMANARSQSPRCCSVLMSSQIGSVASSVVRITSTYPFPRRSPDRALAGLMRQNCHDASWRMDRLLSKVEQGESLDTRSTSIQLREARDELQRLMRGIEGIQKLCELESDDS